MDIVRDVPGFENSYRISLATKEGICYSLNYRKKGIIRPLSNNLRPNGKKKDYRIYWGLHKDGKTTFYQAARWIAITFPELVQNEYFPGAHIDHIDGDPMNNQPHNLRWVTPKGNTINPISLRRRKKALKGVPKSEAMRRKLSEAMINHPASSKTVIQFTKDKQYVHTYQSTAEAERQTKIRRTNIAACARGVLRSAGGYLWFYEN